MAILSLGIVSRLVLGVLLAAPSCPTIRAATGAAYLPITFRSESGPLKTGACLQVNEKVSQQTVSPQGFGVAPDESEKALEAVLTAFKTGNRQALLQLSDPAASKNSTQFDEQVAGYFKQFNAAELVAVAKRFEFDRLTLFFARFQAGKYGFFLHFFFVAKTRASLASCQTVRTI
jgi:hypothetical protein